MKKLIIVLAVVLLASAVAPAADDPAKPEDEKRVDAVANVFRLALQPVPEILSRTGLTILRWVVVIPVSAVQSVFVPDSYYHEFGTMNYVEPDYLKPAGTQPIRDLPAPETRPMKEPVRILPLPPKKDDDL